MSTSIRPATANVTLARHLWRIAEMGEIAQLHEQLGRGADIDWCNDAGTTALMIAAYHGRLEMVRALTDHGANVNLMDNDGLTAAMLAHRRGHDDVVRLLVARGAKKTPATAVLDASANRPAQSKTSVTRLAKDATRSRPAGALPGSPNIWDVVPETQIDFDPKSAFMSHLPPMNIVGLAAIALLMVGGAIFAFLQLKESPFSPPAASVSRESASPAPTTENTESGAASSSAEPGSSPATESLSPDSATPELPARVDSEPSGNSMKPRNAVVTRPAEDSRVPKLRKDQPTSTDFFKKDDQPGSDKTRGTSEASPKSAASPLQTNQGNSTRANETQKPEIKKQNPALTPPPKASSTPKSP